MVDDWRLPAVVSPADLEDCRRSLVAVEEYLAPAQPHQLSGRIVALLRHYFVPAVSGDADKAASLQRAVAHDWHEAIGEFPVWAVMEACRKWINREERRPTPAAIRNECQKLCADQLRTRDRLRKIVRENEAKPAGGNVVVMPRLRRMTEAAE